MILRHEDVRQAAKDWKTFSSDAPFRVPIPSEEDVRTLFQKCTERLESLTVLEATPHVENEVRYQRVIGYESLTLKMVAL